MPRRGWLQPCMNRHILRYMEVPLSKRFQLILRETLTQRTWRQRIHQSIGWQLEIDSRIGSVGEWLKPHLLKRWGQQWSGGSNPSASAIGHSNVSCGDTREGNNNNNNNNLVIGAWIILHNLVRLLRTHYEGIDDLIDLNSVSKLILVKTLDIYIPYIREPITALFFNGSLAQWIEHQTSNLMMMVRFHQESLVFWINLVLVWEIHAASSDYIYVRVHWYNK